MKKNLYRNYAFASAILVAVFPGLVMAQSPENLAVLQIYGAGRYKINMDVGNVSPGGTAWHPEFAGADKDKVIVAQFPAADAWKTASITFTPHKSGYLSIAANGPHVYVDKPARQIKVLPIEFDDFTAEGADLKNGGFEKTDDKGAAYWEAYDAKDISNPIDGSNRAAVIDGDAVEGSRFARVWYGSHFEQSLQVEENVPVTISFSYRKGGEE